MNRKAWGIVVIAIMGLAIAGYYLFNRETETLPQAEDVVRTQPVPVAPPPPPPPPTSTTLPPVAVEPAILHPLETTPAPDPLPDLDKSDAEIIKALSQILGKPWQDFLLPEALIHHIVASVDNLPRKYLPAKVVPIKRVSGAFLTVGDGENLSINTHNPERYTVFIQLIQAIPIEKVVSVYRRYYPMFQKAYAEIGYPKAYFNDRLVEAIDDLLAAPEPEEPIKLVQRKILYQFADPGMEDRSAGQKIMIRMGRDNATRLKAKLREIRSQVAKIS